MNNGKEASANTIVKTTLYDEMLKPVQVRVSMLNFSNSSVKEIAQDFTVPKPRLWSVDHPYLYKAITQLSINGKIIDEYATRFGIRYFNFDADNGFTLNGKPLKIIGVCDHHDLGCLGTAINKRALERQLEILKGMGCNGIRTSHNPPAPELH